MKPHIRKIAKDYYECYVCFDGIRARIGSGSTLHEAWLYCVWGET